MNYLLLDLNKCLSYIYREGIFINLFILRWTHHRLYIFIRPPAFMPYVYVLLK